MASKGRIAGYIVGIIVIVAVLYAVAAYMRPTQPSVPSGTVVLQLTDPPLVPNGTQSLFITYSSVQLHEVGNSNTTGFIDVNASGTVNLMNLTNFTQTIAYAKVNQTQSFDMIRFSITSASITINGTSYPVTVPSSSLLVRLNARLNSTNGVAVIDMTPAVVQIYTGTQEIFVLVPSLKAVVIGSSAVSSASLRVGARERIGTRASEALNQTGASITITSASLAESGNSTLLHVDVRNNGNASVVLKHVMLFGYMRAVFTSNTATGMVPTAGAYGYGAGSGIGAEPFGMMNTSISGLLSGSDLSGHLNEAADIGEALGLNSSTMYKLMAQRLNFSSNSSVAAMLHALNISANATQVRNFMLYMNRRVNASVMEGMHNFNVSSPELHAVIGEAETYMHNYHNVLNFIVAANGTLSLPFTEAEAEGQNGYSLAPGQNVTLLYNGPVILGESHLGTAIIANLTYTVSVSGEDGALASMNVTAS